MKIPLLILVFLFCISSCKKTIETKESTNFQDEFAYFGLFKGKFIEYDVTHIVHDDEVDIHDTTSFRIKTVIGDTITDNEGRKAFKYIRLIWNNANDTWQIKDVWTAIINDNNAELTEENQRTVKLTFPINKNVFWNPNKFSNLPLENATYLQINMPLNYSNYNFDSTITILQNKYFTMVDYKLQTETYAKNVGLISKYFKNLRIKNFDTLQIKKGEEWYYSMTKFGLE